MASAIIHARHKTTMAQTQVGAWTTAAKLLGISLEEYRGRKANGLKHCTACKEWKEIGSFGLDSSREDGLAASCLDCRKKKHKANYTPRPRHASGRRYAVARDGDKLQARGRVNHLINIGAIPDPNALPCVLCGHIWKKGERRHEYDHHLGYDAQNHEKVRALCSTCHGGVSFRSRPRVRDGAGRFT